MAVVAFCALLLLWGARDQAPHARAARPPCSPEEYTYPWGYTERRYDRFFRQALRVVGDRVSHEGQGCVRDGRLGANIGVKDLTEADRRKIEALAPSWVKVNLFGTKYSMDELREFGDRARAVLEHTGLDISVGQSYYGTPGKVGIMLRQQPYGVHQLLRAVIPQDAFFVEEGSFGLAL